MTIEIVLCCILIGMTSAMIFMIALDAIEWRKEFRRLQRQMAELRRLIAEQQKEAANA